MQTRRMPCQQNFQPTNEERVIIFNLRRRYFVEIYDLIISTPPPPPPPHLLPYPTLNRSSDICESAGRRQSLFRYRYLYTKQIKAQISD